MPAGFLNSPGHRLALHLRGAYLTLRRRVNAIATRHGATADQFVLLTLLTAGDGPTQAELVERSFSDPNTIAPMVRLMENKGWVERRRHESDRRARRVFLTGRGRALQRKLQADIQPVTLALAAAARGNGAAGQSLKRMRQRLAALGEAGGQAAPPR